MSGGRRDDRGKTSTAEVPVFGGEAEEAARTVTERELVVAVENGDDPAASRRLEAHWIARQAWPELAQFYRERSKRASTSAERADWLIRLAALLEDELQDPDGAHRAWEAVVRERGDDLALREQVRLLSMKGDASGIRKALDGALAWAQDGGQRARVLTLRGELLLRSGEAERARESFASALASASGHLPALAGRAEADATLGQRDSMTELAAALATAPRRFSGRAELFRRLGRLADEDPEALSVAREAWREVLLEEPEDDEARNRTESIARRSGDDETLVKLLGDWLEQVPRGPRSRAAWLEQVAALERLGRADEALDALRRSVQFEPGHKDAWLALAARCEMTGRGDEAAWALEQAATSMEDEAERAETWLRLARLVRETRGDEDGAAVLERRALRMLEDSRSAGDLAARAPTAIDVPISEPRLQRVRAEQRSLVRRIQAAPLEPDGYRDLGDSFDRLGKRDHRRLMLEIAEALEGNGPRELPTPRLELTAIDRAGLRHPLLRRLEGQLHALTGAAQGLNPAEASRAALPLEVFSIDSGRGAPAAAEALQSAVSILGLSAPEVFISEDRGPPFSLGVADGVPHLRVGWAAITFVLPGAELRFFAGRALFTRDPDVMVLRTLNHEALRPLGAQQLIEAARHSANRAGLVVCGGLGPALTALRAKKALESEIAELVRFAASERYLRLRLRSA